MVLVFSQGEKEEMANMLNCVLGELPMKYLGIPISDHHLTMGAFDFMPQKMITRRPMEREILNFGRETDFNQFLLEQHTFVLYGLLLVS